MTTGAAPGNGCGFHTWYVGFALGRVRVTTQGAGEPLLLIMGIGGHSDMWQPFADAVPDRQLIMFDFPGTGQSTIPWFPPTMIHAAMFVRLLLRRVGLRSVDVLGYSWGGLLAQQLAAQHPGSVRQLILACTGPGLGGVPASFRVTTRLLSPRRYYSRPYLAKIAADTYGGEMRRDPALLNAETVRRMDRPPSWLGYGHQLLSAATFSTYPIAPLIRQRTLILGGGDDPIVRPANQHILHRLLRNSDLTLVESAGHLLLLEDPERSAALVRTFLAGGTDGVDVRGTC
jgi:pimeloyl-ACP methyl ester carboxylesterase